MFDVSHVTDRDVDIRDIDLSAVGKDMFLAFYTGFIEREPYGSPAYFQAHPQLSRALIEALLEKEVSIIGLDFAGIRRGKEHPLTDQACADRGVFIVENLCSERFVKDKFIPQVFDLRDKLLTGIYTALLIQSFSAAPVY